MWENFDLFLEILGLCEQSHAVQNIIERFKLKRDHYSGVTYLESQPHGLALSYTDNGIDAVFLHGAGKDEFNEYQGKLIGELSFQSIYIDVRNILGEPKVFKKEKGKLCDFQVIEYDRWDFHTHSIFFNYKPFLKGIDLITVQPPQK